MIVEQLRPVIEGRRCVVLGAAPMPAPIHVEPDDVLIAVNGGISSYARTDVWVLNAREHLPTAHAKLGALMLRQGADRVVGAVVLLLKGGEDAGGATLRRLVAQHTVINTVVELGQINRTRIETATGARTPDMTKHALSAGLFAAALAFDCGAATVRLEGFSWRGGYAYTDTPVSRGHAAGDKAALANLRRRFPHRLLSTLNQELSMPAAPRPITTADVPPVPRAAARKVRATAMAWYDNKRRRVGDVYVLRKPTDFKKRCMVDVDDTAPVHTTSTLVARQRENAAILRGKSPRLSHNGADVILDDAPITEPADGVI